MREDSQTGKRSNAAREDKHSGDHLKRESNTCREKKKHERWRLVICTLLRALTSG